MHSRSGVIAHLPPFEIGCFLWARSSVGSASVSLLCPTELWAFKWGVCRLVAQPSHAPKYGPIAQLGVQALHSRSGVIAHLPPFEIGCFLWARSSVGSASVSLLCPTELWAFKWGVCRLVAQPSHAPKYGPIAQLGERSVRIREVKGSNPSRSTIQFVLEPDSL